MAAIRPRCLTTITEVYLPGLITLTATGPTITITGADITDGKAGMAGGEVADTIGAMEGAPVVAAIIGAEVAPEVAAIIGAEVAPEAAVTIGAEVPKEAVAMGVETDMVDTVSPRSSD
jgi:hypothetical protein